MYKYKRVRQRLFNEYIGSYISYGIKLKGHNIIVDDVGCDSCFVDSVIRYLNKHQVSPVHLRDVIEDMLALY